MVLKDPKKEELILVTNWKDEKVLQRVSRITPTYIDTYQGLRFEREKGRCISHSTCAPARAKLLRDEEIISLQKQMRVNKMRERLSKVDWSQYPDATVMDVWDYINAPRRHNKRTLLLEPL